MTFKINHCDVVELNNHNIIFPKSFRTPLYLNNKPNIILNKKTLNIENDNVEVVSFTKISPKSQSDKIQICGYILYTYPIKNTKINLGNVIFSFSYSDLNLKNLVNELSEKLKILVCDISDINFYKFHIMKEFLSTFIKRSEISNLKNILSVFDIAEFDKFEIKDEFYNLNFNKLKCNFTYNLNKKKHTIQNLSIPIRYSEKPIIYSKADFVIYDSSDIFKNFKLLMYIIYKTGGAEKYHEFNSDFEKYLILNS